MKSLLKVAVLAFAFSGLVACSSAKKEDDSVMADLSQAEESVQSSDESANIADTVEDSSSQSYTDDESSPSLGTGSSGLGH